MTLYEKIKTIVESGHIAITQDDGGNYILRSSISGDDIRNSEPCKNIENCFFYLGSEFSTKEDIIEYEKEGEKYIGIYQHPLRIPKEGDMVQVLENVKQFPDYRDPEVNDLIGKPIRSQEISGEGFIWLDIKGKKEVFPLSCLAPWIEPDTDPTIKIIDGKRYKLLDDNL